jgi:ribosomal protein S18 acetylase RimI-like enzyme
MLELMQLSEPLTIRQATAADLNGLSECDPFAADHPERNRFLSVAIERGECWVAFAADGPKGYVVLNYNFFENGFIPLVVVAPSARRRGIGHRLLAAAEAQCRTPKLFASTNTSNIEAQRLLTRAGFVPSGRVENLDADNPELVYFKRCAAPHPNL